MVKLTAKQQKFCEEYMVDGNATRSAIAAGYSKKTAQQVGSENLLKPVIAGVIEKLRGKVSERTELTVDLVVKGIRGIAEDEEASDGNRLRAWELLGRHTGGFDKDRPTGDKPQENHIHFHQMSRAEQEKMIQMALNTEPLRLNPPNAVQGDTRPSGIEDEDNDEDG